MTLSLNRVVLDYLREYEDFITVKCDFKPSYLVSWYNKETKEIMSNESLL
jgi:hypothetical protein